MFLFLNVPQCRDSEKINLLLPEIILSSEEMNQKQKGGGA